MNYLLEIDCLSNRYFAMRHGHSIANQQGIIVSHPDNGRERFGLSEPGREQLKQSLQNSGLLDIKPIIVSSDFLRAKESAEIASTVLQADGTINLDKRLRERNFGELELTADRGYADVWREDAENPDHQLRGVESVNQVMTRVTSAVAEYENRFADATILLVSHGDALQILQTAFARMDGSSHRQLEHLRTGQIRQLQFG
ncbi:MAG: histidine phosphatase family protein, partial [Gammaproteobacteria bacterium]|nr:histidine phosphatase family protein [Gammaproteobacteria bacterium]